MLNKKKKSKDMNHVLIVLIRQKIVVQPITESVDCNLMRKDFDLLVRKKTYLIPTRKKMM